MTHKLSTVWPQQAPPLFEKEEVREKLRKLPGGPAQPLTVHLRQEIDRMNLVVMLTVSRLKDLRLAVAGACSCQILASTRLCFMGWSP